MTTKQDQPEQEHIYNIFNKLWKNNNHALINFRAVRPSWMSKAYIPMSLWFVFNTKKNRYLNRAAKNNTCQIFKPKNSQNQVVFEIQKNPSIIPVILSPGTPTSPPWGVGHTERLPVLD